LSLPQFQSDDQVFQMMQNQWGSILDPVVRNSIVNGTAVKNVSLIRGQDNVVAHKLDRKYQGWFITRITPTTTTQGYNSMTDWVSYTPTGSFTTNTTYGGVWKQVGDNIECKITLGFSGAPNAVNLTFSQAQAFPNSYAIDTTKLPLYSTSAANNKSFTWNSGVWNAVDAGNNNYGGFVMWDANAAFFRILTSTSPTANVSATSPFSFGATDSIDINLTMPIVGFSAFNNQDLVWEATLPQGSTADKFINLHCGNNLTVDLYVF
jgi:hypothetical protein